jgi:glycosyltransferase involved in cell wall biosynthesis
MTADNMGAHISGGAGISFANTNRSRFKPLIPTLVTMPHRNQPNSRGADLIREHPFIVQSHLRWDFVWQRPQQLMSRLATKSPILFIEEPVHLDDIGAGQLDLTVPVANVFRVVPRLTGELRGDYDRSIEEVRRLVAQELASGGRLERRFANAIQWFYTPMPATTMLGAFNEIGVVYDCMDELSQFRNAPPELKTREDLLISNADVVFTGGYKLFKSRAASHHNVHFFGCGVDVNHFGRARNPDTQLPADVPSRGPVAGYFGVIDERLDYGVIDALAARYPECNVVMVGPTAKIDVADLPRRHNIYWLGQRSYDQLPAYVKAFDVCLMPFALNEATEYINPTKTLEYMAAGKPIVSTAVPDVVTNFTPIVTVAHSEDEFVDAVVKAAATPDTEAIFRGIEMATASTWERIVASMRSIINEAVDKAPILTEFASKQSVSKRAKAELPRA